MSDRTWFEVTIYSPRWGRDDPYLIELEQNQLKIGRSADPNPSICTWVEDHGPAWSTSFPHLTNRNPVESTLENDAIYPPTYFVRGLESAWLAWRRRELDDEQVRAELTTLCNWVSTVSRAKPSTEFWESKF